MENFLQFGQLEARRDQSDDLIRPKTVSYTHLRAHETEADLVCRLLLEKKKGGGVIQGVRTLNGLF